MAIIFFEGFNAGRVRDTAYWTDASTGFVWGNPYEGRRIGGSASAAGSDPQKTLTLSNIGTNTGKLYLGFGLKNMGAVGTLTHFLDFYNSSNSPEFYLAGNIESGEEFFSISLVQGATELGKWNFTFDQAKPYWYGGPDYKYYSGWRFLEFEIDMTATTHKLTMRLDGAGYATSTAAEYIEFGTNLTDIAMMRFFGLSTPNVPQYFDDLYLLDASGTTANSWLGDDAVVQPMDLNESAAIVDEWTVKGGLPVLSSDDGDASYIRTATVDKTQLYPVVSITPIAADPTIGGVRIQSRARKVFLDAAYKHIYRAPNSVIYDLNYAPGNAKVALTNTTYTTKSFILGNNPQTNAAWTLTSLNNGYWGVQSVSPS